MTALFMAKIIFHCLWNFLEFYASCAFWMKAYVQEIYHWLRKDFWVQGA